MNTNEIEDTVMVEEVAETKKERAIRLAKKFALSVAGTVVVHFAAAAVINLLESKKEDEDEDETEEDD